METFQFISNKQARQIIVDEFIKASPSFKLDKFSKRSYLFTRITNEHILETVNLYVIVAKGKLYCSIKSLLDFSRKDDLSVTDGLLNQTFPKNLSYKFNNSVSSYSKAIAQFIYDFNKDCLVFLDISSKRIHDKRITVGFEYINNLIIDKKQLKKEFYEANTKAKYSIPKTKHPIFTNLVEKLSTIKKGKYEIENHMIAFDFLYIYMYDQTNAQLGFGAMGAEEHGL